MNRKIKIGVFLFSLGVPLVALLSFCLSYGTFPFLQFLASGAVITLTALFLLVIDNPSIVVAYGSVCIALLQSLIILALSSSVSQSTLLYTEFFLYVTNLLSFGGMSILAGFNLGKRS